MIPFLGLGTSPSQPVSYKSVDPGLAPGVAGSGPIEGVLPVSPKPFGTGVGLKKLQERDVFFSSLSTRSQLSHLLEGNSDKPLQMTFLRPSESPLARFTKNDQVRSVLVVTPRFAAETPADEFLPVDEGDVLGGTTQSHNPFATAASEQTEAP